MVLKGSANTAYTLTLDTVSIGTGSIGANGTAPFLPGTLNLGSVTDGSHTLAVTGTGNSLSVNGAAGVPSITIKIGTVSTALPTTYSTTDSTYYIIRDTESAIKAADSSNSVLSQLMKAGRVLGAISKDGTPPSTPNTPFPTLGTDLIPIIGYNANNQPSSEIGRAHV